MRTFTGILVVFFLILCTQFCCNKNVNDVVKPLDKDALNNIIAQRNGKILLLNVWASWCVPCREEFPELVKLANEFKHKDVEIVGLSADYPDEIETNVLPFLQKQKINFKVYVQNFKNDTELIDFLNSEWAGSLPATFIYDQSGKQRMFIKGAQDYNSLQTILDNFLNES